jgi:tetratricopeptide (TPR) repeat protein
MPGGEQRGRREREAEAASRAARRAAWSGAGGRARARRRDERARAPRPRFDAEAIRLNNRGVAQMGQQFTERAAGRFAAAFKKDPKLAQAAINEGIALLTLQKLDEAKKALQAGLALDPESAQAWYNLGLAQHAGNELEPALASFQQAVKLDPRDADSYYFEGVCYQEMKQFDKAIAIFEKALAINPLHASAEFAMARALQRTGRTAEAKDALQAVSAFDEHQDFCAHRAVYGEQGHYSTVTPVEEPERAEGMIPVKLVAQPMVWPQVRKSGKDGAPNSRPRRRGLHDGRDRLGTNGPGADAVGRAGDSRAAQAGDGSFEELDAAARD